MTNENQTNISRQELLPRVMEATRSKMLLKRKSTLITVDPNLITFNLRHNKKKKRQPMNQDQAIKVISKFIKEWKMKRIRKKFESNIV